MLPAGNVPGSASPAACLGGGSTVKRRPPAHPQSLQQSQLKYFSLFLPAVFNDSGFDEMPQEAPSQKYKQKQTETRFGASFRWCLMCLLQLTGTQTDTKPMERKVCDFLSSTGPSFDFQLKTFLNLTFLTVQLVFFSLSTAKLSLTSERLYLKYAT